jgi:small subunit ribosomal protein S20
MNIALFREFFTWGCAIAQRHCQTRDCRIQWRVFAISKGFKEFFMANSAQARKRARQSIKQNMHNASLRSELRTAVKKVQKAIVAGDKASAQKIYQESMSVIDRIADKKIIHKNKASRHKSRLAAQVKALA